MQQKNPIYIVIMSFFLIVVGICVIAFGFWDVAVNGVDPRKMYVLWLVSVVMISLGAVACSNKV